MARGRLTAFHRQHIESARNAGSNEASWRSGYAEDCKSLHPGSIPGEASSCLGSLGEQAFRSDWTAVVARQAGLVGRIGWNDER